MGGGLSGNRRIYHNAWESIDSPHTVADYGRITAHACPLVGQ